MRTFVSGLLPFAVPCFKKYLFTALLCLSGLPVLAANYPANIDYGQLGDFIAKRGSDKGRTAILAPIGPILLNLPEAPGSSGKNVNLTITDTAWNLEDLSNPQLIGEINCNDSGTCLNGHGIRAHAVYTRFTDDEAYFFGNFHWQQGAWAYYDPSQANPLDEIQRTSPSFQVGRGGDYAGLTSKYYANMYWEYNPSELDNPLLLTENFGTPSTAADAAKVTALGLEQVYPPAWIGTHASDIVDHLALTGVTGFPVFSGNLLVMASDQQNTGVAIYDISHIDPNTPPSLITVFNPALTEPSGRTVRIGGYWAEPYGANKVVFSARPSSRRDDPALYIVDFEDPQNPILSCEIYFDQDRATRADGDFHSNPMYVNFQDQYVYVDHFRVDIEQCEQVYAQAKALDPTHILSSSEYAPFVYKFDDTAHYCDGSQYFRPLGQVGVFGGYDLGPDVLVTLDSPVAEQHLGYYQWFSNQSSDGGGHLNSEHAGNVYGASVFSGGAFWQVGDVLRSPDGSEHTIMAITTDSPDMNFQGMCFFVTSDEADTRPPYVSGHRPLAGQTNVPVSTMIHLHIPETLRSESMIQAITLTRLDTNAEVAIEYQLSHTGTIAIFPLSDLTVDVAYQVDIAGVQDFMGNTMIPYSFTFSTGNAAPPPPPPPGGTTPPTFSGTPFYPNQSSQLACSLENEVDNVWAVNPDNNSVSIIDTNFISDEFELDYAISNTIQSSYLHPSSITRVGNRYAVTYRDSDRIVFYNSTGSIDRDMDTGYGTQPISSVSDGTYLYVALYRAGIERGGNVGETVGSEFGEILKIRLSDHSIVARETVGPTPKGMALHNGRLLVTRFISPSTHAEVYDLDTSDLSLTRTIAINKVAVEDDLDHGSGVPNFLNSIVISPDGALAYVAAVKQNVDTNQMDDDNTVRAMAAIIDLVNHQDSNQEPTNRDGTWDFDNSADPQYVSYLVNGDPVFAFQGNNTVRVFDLDDNVQTVFNTGFAPQSSCATLRTLYVKNFTDRSVSAIDVAGWMHDQSINPQVTSIPLITPANDVLSQLELNGLQAFYHAEMPVFGPEGYMSCASCHMGGGHDGQVWNMTQFGEGLRNTLSLNGQAGTRFGNLHWTSNFDEVQDFIFQIINLNLGTADVSDFDASRNPLQVATTGLSTTIDALAAYVSSLGQASHQRSVVQANNSENAAQGEQLFYDRNCVSCHAPPAFTDGLKHDVGTGLAIRTPRLIDLHDSAPYLHDGRALSLDQVFNQGSHAEQVQGLNDTQRRDLLTYLLALDRSNFISDEATFTGLPSYIGQFTDLISLPAGETEWNTCAVEGGICSVPANAIVRYGDATSNSFHYAHGLSGDVTCDSASFGSPFNGNSNSCSFYVQSASVTAVPIMPMPLLLALVSLLLYSGRKALRS